ncbi:hypothetical protein LINPERPRIM_LOCUS32642 [Linum perenne]
MVAGRSGGCCTTQVQSKSTVDRIGLAGSNGKTRNQGSARFDMCLLEGRTNKD